MLVLGKCAAQRAELAERAYLVLATSQKAAFAPYKAQLLKLLKMKRKGVVGNIFPKPFLLGQGACGCIPDICYGSHGYTRVNFFWPV